MYLPLDLLEATNSTRANLISIIILQLIELTGRAQSILAPHYGKNNRPSSNTNMTHSKRIVKAFESFEKCNQGNFVAQHFRTEAPYASMHADICTLALARKQPSLSYPPQTMSHQWEAGSYLCFNQSAKSTSNGQGPLFCRHINRPRPNKREK